MIIRVFRCAVCGFSSRTEADHCGRPPIGVDTIDAGEVQIAVGDAVVWRRTSPHARADLLITKLIDNGEEIYVEAYSGDGSYCWNDLGLFMEACYPGVPCPEYRGSDVRPSVVPYPAGV